MSSRPETITSTAGSSSPGAEALIGTRVHKYEIVRVLGQGGMGTVYEALNTAIGKRVAMKFIDAETARNKDAVARFQREAEAASAVESAHIVEIFDSGYTDDGRPYIVMELLRGEDLGHRIRRCGRLELPEAMHIAAQILRGLHRAHEAGIVHRDLKPDNVFLVDRDDDPSFAKILDFGISKVHRNGQGAPVHTLTRQGTVLGTPFYMSPEQAQALADIDGRTDLWSLGAILYECLTGRPPHTGTSYEQVIVNICMHDADDVRAHNPAVPEGVARVISRALSRDRSARFTSAREFLDALKAVAGPMISSRAGLGSGADSAPGASGGGAGDFRVLTPGEGGGTPRQASSPFPAGMEPTLEASQASVSKVGWSTSQREASRRDKRTALAVALTALLAGGVGAFLFVRSRPARPHDEPAAVSAGASAEGSVQIRTNVAAARVLVDGVEAPGGLVKGHKGDSKKARIEAAGYTPSEIEVTIDTDQESMQVNLVPAAPGTALAVSPAPETTGAVSVAMGNVKVRPGGKVRPGSPGSKAVEPAVAVVPKENAQEAPRTSPPPETVVTPPAAPRPTKAPGVGGELKLKTD